MKYFVILLLCSVLTSGCTAAKTGAEHVGEASGKAVDVMNTLSSTGAEELHKDKQDNPYNR